MRLVKTVRQMRDLMVQAGGDGSTQACNSILLESIMDDDMSVVSKVRRAVSGSMLKVACAVDPES